LPPPHYLYKSFAAFDEDDSGAIELDECAAIFADLGDDITPARLKKLFTEFDDDDR
jgi:Ca2+-binding EF-hand superfamily protein